MPFRGSAWTPNTVIDVSQLPKWATGPIPPAIACRFIAAPDALEAIRAHGERAYCGATTIEIPAGDGSRRRLSYCAEHAALCYQRLPEFDMGELDRIGSKLTKRRDRRRNRGGKPK